MSVRCTLEPLADHQVSFRIRGVEHLRWHYGPSYPRPFFFPFRLTKDGESLTRMGHPGAPDHDHHRSIWFAHQKVSGVDFWSDRTEARIRQLEWLAYQDGDDEAIMAVTLGWFDGHNPAPLLKQQLIAAVRPGDEGEIQLELQSAFTPTAATLEFGKTNFGFLAVRMAKALSTAFGTGRLTNSHGQTGEPAIFAKPATWVNYAGRRHEQVEGVTYFDHPSNPSYPSSWHVRHDGWMGCSATLREGLVTTQDKPLSLRYLLLAHTGEMTAPQAERIARRFHESRPFVMKKSPAANTAWGVRRTT